MLQEEEFKSIFTSQYNKLYQVSLNIIRDEDQAHDAVQEVFTRLWNKRQKLMFTAPVEVYLRKAVINTSLNFIKQNNRKIHIDQIADLPYQTETDIVNNEFKVVLERGIATLPPKSKTIFILSRIEGLDNQEIADYLDISKKTVENQISIALKKLKEYFEDQRSANPDLFKTFMFLFY